VLDEVLNDAMKQLHMHSPMEKVMVNSYDQVHNEKGK